MRSIHSSFKRRLTILRTVYVRNRFSFPGIASLLFVVIAVACSRNSSPVSAPVFSDYPSFVSSYAKKVDPVSEIYGQYAAEQSSKRIRAKFNLLLDPGKRAYIEILDPSDRLVNVLSLSKEKISLLWAKENTYIEEKATPQNLQAVLGLPVHSDDALQLISGQGLQFNAWQEAESRKDGWKLTRGPAAATIIMKENLSRIETSTAQGSFSTFYEKYELMNERSMPTRIRFEMPARKTSLELRIDKYVPRAEEVTAGVFDIKLPANAKRLALNDIYHGKPLLMQ